ncbi:MAG: YueI family protein [Lactobacillus sp.]|nr:YueI family protein [Lactobacillus sp.]MDN6042781.1 YueI family protein [Lactobacillus sp.]MDN6052383.1 YueI family protein [Lactobacillus sp.]
MSENLENRVNQAANGVPQTKPDERKRFLGSLRERVFVRMDNSEISNHELTELFLSHFADYEPYRILINGNVSDTGFFTEVEAKASQANIPFTLINNETAQTNTDGTALLVVAEQALNRPHIGIRQVYPPEFPHDALPSPAKHTNFFSRLFHKES